MKYLFLLVGLSILATGCATINHQQKEKIPMSEAQQLEVQMRQTKAIAETALDVSKEAQKYSQKAYNTSNQANATANTAFQAANNAIKAAQQATEYANQASQKAINAANNAILVSNENTDTCIAAVNQMMAEMGRLKATVKTVQYEPVLPSRPKIFSQTNSEFGRKYTIKSGDTLSGISLNFYGNANAWEKIYNANRDIIKNPYDLTIGTQIIIPQ